MSPYQCQSLQLAGVREVESLAFQVGKAALVPRDQAARSTGDKDVQKVQEPASKAYRDMAADAAEFQACSHAHRHTLTSAALCQCNAVSGTPLSCKAGLKSCRNSC